MKLKNKKTGEIRNAVDIDMYTDSVYLKVSDGEFDNETIEYHSLAELNEEWEDALEEAIQVYIEGIQEVHSGGGRVFIDYATAKEAELAVRKIKAWKRLKDKGMRTFSFKIEKRGIDLDYYTLTILAPRDKDSLAMLFGGEE